MRIEGGARGRSERRCMFLPVLYWSSAFAGQKRSNQGQCRTPRFHLAGIPDGAASSPPELRAPGARTCAAPKETWHAGSRIRDRGDAHDREGPNQYEVQLGTQLEQCELRLHLSTPDAAIDNLESSDLTI